MGDIAEMRHALVQIIRLGYPAQNPVDARPSINRRPCGERGRSRSRIGRLAVIDVENAVARADRLHPVGEAGVADERIGDGRLINAQRFGHSNCDSGVLRIMRALQGGPRQLGDGINVARPNLFHVIPAQAGIHFSNLALAHNIGRWVPAFAGMTEVLSNRPARFILRRDHRDMIRRLHRKQPRLARHIALKPVIAIKVIGRDIEQHRHIAVQAMRQVDLVTRQFQHIDARPLQVRLQRRLAQDRQADIATHHRRITGLLDDMVDQRRGGRLAVGASDADHLVRR